MLTDRYLNHGTKQQQKKKRMLENYPGYSAVRSSGGLLSIDWNSHRPVACRRRCLIFNVVADSLTGA